MAVFRTIWRAVMAAAFTLALAAGAAYARGGGHAGSIARPMSSSSMPMTRSPALGLSGVHPASPLSGGLARQFEPKSATRVPDVGTVISPATIGRPQPMRTPRASPGRSGSAATVGALFNSGVGIIPTPSPPAPTPPAEIAAPAPELAPIAPLSPQLETQFSTGGVAQPNMALSPGASPSDAAPSTPGGGGASLADCMGFCDRETHMTKAEWKAACPHHAGLSDGAALTDFVRSPRSKRS